MKKKDGTFTMYLEDILLSMQKIEKYVEGYDFEVFKADSKTIDAVVRNFEIIGEASKNLPDDLKAKYTEVPWQEMYLLRNRVSHEYFGIDTKLSGTS